MMSSIAPGRSTDSSTTGIRAVRAALRAALPAALLLAALASAAPAGELGTRTNGVPWLSRIIVIVMENHGYDQVRTAPYTASLIASGNVCTTSYAVTHPSQPNYFTLWAGSTLGVANDDCPPAGTPHTAENLGQACEEAGVSWRTYAEDLPSAGWNGCSAAGGLYHRRHCPWVSFTNLNHLNERPYSDFAADVAAGTLPRLVFVIPNNCHNTHDCSIQTGDDWLAANVPAMLQAVGSFGVVILTWDEDDDNAGNHILTLFAGNSVLPGHATTRYLTHFTVLRTICDGLGIPAFGVAQYDTPITEGWADPTAGFGASGMPVSLLGPAVPNPSRTGFEIRLAADPRSVVDAAVYSAGGTRIRDLGHDLGCDPGRDPGRDLDPTGAVIRWNGRDQRDVPAAAGVYFLRVRSGDRSLEQRLVVIR